MFTKTFTVAIVAVLFTAISVFSADQKEVKIQTNLHCGSCASKIEKGLKKTNGVVYSKANVESKIVTIKYDADKTNEISVTKSIQDLGYKAEVVKTEDHDCDANGRKNKGKDCCDTKATKSAPKK